MIQHLCDIETKQERKGNVVLKSMHVNTDFLKPWSKWTKYKNQPINPTPTLPQNGPNFLIFPIYLYHITFRTQKNA